MLAISVTILEILSVKMYYVLDLDKANLNMLIQSPYATSYLMAIVMFALSVTILEIFSQNAHDFDLDILNEPRSNVNMPKLKCHMHVPICWQ